MNSLHDVQYFRTHLNPERLEGELLRSIATLRGIELDNPPRGRIANLLALTPSETSVQEYLARLIEPFLDVVTDDISIETKAPWPTRNYDVQIVAALADNDEEIVFSFVDRVSRSVEADLPAIRVDAILDQFRP